MADNDTIACYWDADRLDLRRLAMDPNPNLLFTAEAKAMAEGADFRAMEKFRY